MFGRLRRELFFSQQTIHCLPAARRSLNSCASTAQRSEGNLPVSPLKQRAHPCAWMEPAPRRNSSRNAERAWTISRYRCNRQLSPNLAQYHGLLGSRNVMDLMEAQVFRPCVPARLLQSIESTWTIACYSCNTELSLEFGLGQSVLCPAYWDGVDNARGIPPRVSSLPLGAAMDLMNRRLVGAFDDH